MLSFENACRGLYTVFLLSHSNCLPELILMTLFIPLFSLVHFRGIMYALSALWRTLTGEDWYQFMWDAAVSSVLDLTRDTIVDILIVR